MRIWKSTVMSWKICPCWMQNLSQKSDHEFCILPTTQGPVYQTPLFCVYFVVLVARMDCVHSEDQSWNRSYCTLMPTISWWLCNPWANDKPCRSPEEFAIPTIGIGFFESPISGWDLDFHQSEIMSWNQKIKKWKAQLFYNGYLILFDIHYLPCITNITKNFKAQSWKYKCKSRWQRWASYTHSQKRWFPTSLCRILGSCGVDHSPVMGLKE